MTESVLPSAFLVAHTVTVESGGGVPLAAGDVGHEGDGGPLELLGRGIARRELRILPLGADAQFRAKIAVPVLRPAIDGRRRNAATAALGDAQRGPNSLAHGDFRLGHVRTRGGLRSACPLDDRATDGLCVPDGPFCGPPYSAGRPKQKGWPAGSAYTGQLPP